METILIVDDEVRIRRVFRQLLEYRGYRVLAAPNAIIAREAIEKYPVSLVLLDINLGDVNGGALFDVISAFHPGLKVIVSSVYPFDEQKKIIGHADDYYDKSESIETLMEKINRLLGGAQDAKRKNILIIDDDPQFRSLYHQILVRAGYRAEEVSDSLRVLEKLRSRFQDIDLILLDLAMPNISGQDFYEIIKKKFPDVKIIIVSNFPVGEQAFHIFDADDYFDKSDGCGVLLEKIRHLV